MRPPARQLLFVLVALVLLCGGAAAESRSPGTPRSFDHEGLRSRAELPVFELPAVDLDALVAEDAIAATLLDKPLRIGFPMKADVEPSRLGLWEPLPDDDRLWRLRVRTRQALWVVLGFGTFRPPPGAELYVYDEGGSRVLGPFTAENVRPDGQLWMPPIEGDVLVVEIFWPAALAGVSPNVHLGTVTHGYKPFGRIGKHHTGNDGDSGSCNNDVNCPEGDPWQSEKDGVVNMLSGSGGQICTASLITNTNQDCRNLVLTADHCGLTPASTVFQFNYQRPGCNSGNAPTNEVVTGSTRLASYGPSDMQLLEMTNDPDGAWNVFYNGWSRDTTAPTSSTGIHHPRGDVKKITFNDDPLIDGQNYGPDHWRITEWEDGTTEGGSSGSPLFDQNHRIVGQLHGGTASCSSITWDEYGKVDVSWDGGGTSSSRLRDWLDPSNTGALTADGIDWNSCQTPQPRLAYDSSVVSDAAGNGDGVVDPGETLELRVAELNNGTLDATSVTGTLATTTPLVTVDDGASDWPNIPQGQSRQSLAPHFTATLDSSFVCGDAIDLQLTMNATEGAGTWNHEFTVPTGTAQLNTEFSDDMEAGTAGWTTQEPSGSSPWGQTTADANSPATSWFVSDIATVSDSVLVMPQLTTLLPNYELRFMHRLNTESSYDGGVLEYSTDGSTWNDAGPLITSGGYTGTISTCCSSPIGGRQAWFGDSGGWTEVRVDLDSLAGQNVTFRWRAATDSSVSDEGWYVDDVVVESTTYICNAFVRPGEAAADHAFTLQKDPGGFLLNWSASPSGGAPDRYKLYRMDLSTDPPAATQCEADLGTGLSIVLPTLTDNQGFMVVAQNAAGEGSYGQDSDGTERDPATGGNVCP
ncbi:MAG: choice-of-anchor J domain-containing protein [Acidobacteriota bacterium]|nr:choice-of-anchor J domain-containing protein [Acidobacteriota bacterium]